MTELKRNCPLCNKELIYTQSSNFYSAKKNNTVCRSCSKKDMAGDKNPFYGKKHSADSKDKMSIFQSSVRVFSDIQKEQARKQLAKVTNDRSLYSIWLEKFGKEIADQKLLNFKQKQSKNNSGINNNMYGKPSPQGSGNGWSGWYKGWYFRSLRELSYVINVLERNNITWRVPDKEFRITYTDHLGKIKTYLPDFIINETKIIEIKPKKLHNSPKVIAKKLAAEKFCEQKLMSYEILDPKILSENEIKQLYICGEIIFLDKYDLKFKERYMK